MDRWSQGAGEQKGSKGEGGNQPCFPKF